MPTPTLICYLVCDYLLQTIDNDVDLLDRSFGFTTSVEAAQRAIHVAVTEATCNLPNGIGIVKVKYCNNILVNVGNYKCSDSKLLFTAR
jgi:hypothetical protein